MPDSFADELIEAIGRELPWRAYFNRDLKPYRMTWRQKLRLRWFDVKWAIHDRVFGPCYEEDR